MNQPQPTSAPPTTTDDQRPADTPPIAAVPRIILVVGRNTSDVGLVAVLASADGHLPLMFPEIYLHPSQHIPSIRKYIDSGKPLVIATHSETIVRWFVHKVDRDQLLSSEVEVLRVCNDRTIKRYEFTLSGVLEPDWPGAWWVTSLDEDEEHGSPTAPKELVIPARSIPVDTTR